jgi:small subunit ribosomal protein S21
VASLTRAKVEVTDNKVEAALKTLKKVMIKGGLYQEMKRRVYYEKPSVKRKRKQAQARRKRRKAMRRQQQPDDD